MCAMLVLHVSVSTEVAHDGVGQLPRNSLGDLVDGIGGNPSLKLVLIKH